MRPHTFTRKVRTIVAAVALSGAAAVAVGVNAAPAHAAAYEIAPINNYRAFGIGPLPSQQACNEKAAYLTSLGARSYGDGFGRCIYDPNVGWLATSPWAQ